LVAGSCWRHPRNIWSPFEVEVAHRHL
jgi:hypothetical protein